MEILSTLWQLSNSRGVPGVVRCQVSISEHLTEVGPVRLLHLLAFGLRGSLLPPHLVPNAMVALAVLGCACGNAAHLAI